MKLYVVCYPIYDHPGKTRCVHKVFGQRKAAKKFCGWLLKSGDSLEEEVALEEVEFDEGILLEMAQNLVKFNVLISLEKLRGILADLVDGVCELAWCEYVNRTSYMVNIRKKDSESLVENAAKRILTEVIVVKPDES